MFNPEDILKQVGELQKKTSSQLSSLILIKERSGEKVMVDESLITCVLPADSNSDFHSEIVLTTGRTLLVNLSVEEVQEQLEKATS